MNDTKPTVHIDGTDYPLDSYPQAQLDFFEFTGETDEGAVAYLEEMQDTPGSALDVAAREYDNAIILDHTILPLRRIGTAEEVMFANNRDQAKHGSVCYARFRGYENGGCDADFDERWNWLSDHHFADARTITWRRDDTGDGILLDRYVFFIAFHDEADDAAFLAAFPEAAR